MAAQSQEQSADLAASSELFRAEQCRHLARLISLFPDLSSAELKSLLELCEGDFIRAVDNVLYTQYRMPVLPTSQYYNMCFLPRPLPSFQNLKSQVLPKFAPYQQDGLKGPQVAEEGNAASRGELLGDYVQEIAGIGPLPQLVQPTTVCQPEHARLHGYDVT